MCPNNDLYSVFVGQSLECVYLVITVYRVCNVVVVLGSSLFLNKLLENWCGSREVDTWYPEVGLRGGFGGFWGWAVSVEIRWFRGASESLEDGTDFEIGRGRSLTGGSAEKGRTSGLDDSQRCC
jgi:hypothetical protein